MISESVLRFMTDHEEELEKFKIALALRKIDDLQLLKALKEQVYAIKDTYQQEVGDE